MHTNKAAEAALFVVCMVSSGLDRSRDDLSSLDASVERLLLEQPARQPFWRRRILAHRHHFDFYDSAAVKWSRVLSSNARTT